MQVWHRPGRFHSQDTLLDAVTVAPGLEIHRISETKMTAFKKDPLSLNASVLDEL